MAKSHPKRLKHLAFRIIILPNRRRSILNYVSVRLSHKQMDLFDYLGFRWLISRIIRFRPYISKQGPALVARSGARSQICSLGFAGRKVEVDPIVRFVRVTNRLFWFLTSSRRIEFDRIAEILYDYNDVGVGFWAYQQLDLFIVRLLLKDNEEVVLFRFFGEGDFVNYTTWPDWMYLGDHLEARLTKGDQERESLYFAEMLSGLIGVPIGNSAI